MGSEVNYQKQNNELYGFRWGSNLTENENSSLLTKQPTL